MRFAALAALLAAACYTPQNPSLCDGVACGGSGSGDAAIPADEYVSLSVGARSACAIGADDRGLYCWGDNTVGQIGIGLGTRVVERPTRIDGTEYAAVAVGGDHACAVTKSDNKVLCWGDNNVGQSDPTAASPGPAPPTEVTVTGITGDLVLAAGPTLSCVSGNGGTTCWGKLLASDASPTFTTTSFTALAIGTRHACGLTGDGDLVCWGDNSVGQLDPNASSTPGTLLDPVPVNAGPPSMTQISAGHDETCAVGEKGEAHCWGVDENGGLGSINLGNNWSSVVVGERLANGIAETCGVQGGHVQCWGGSRFGGLGDGVWRESGIVPSAAKEIGTADEVHLGLAALGTLQGGEATAFDEGGCVVEARIVRCWGSNRRGELGTIASQQPPVEVMPPGGEMWAHVTAGDQHTCALSAQGHVYCWGADDLGQTDGSAHAVCDESCDKPSPTLVPLPSTESSQVLAAADFSCARGLTSVTCWGDNSAGGLGNPGSGMQSPQADHDQPLFGGPRAMCGQSGGLDVCWGTINGVKHTMADSAGLGALAIDAAFLDSNLCVQSTAGKRLCAGNNQQGEMGDGTQTANPTPTDKSGGLTYTAIAGRFEHLCGVTTQQGVVCWGGDVQGEAGAPPAMDVLTPQPITGLGAGVCNLVTTGRAHSCAACGGSVLCWGRGGLGELGESVDDGASTFEATPVGVPSGEMYVEVSAGNDHTCAMTDTNRIFCWGFGPRGELGNGSHGSAVPVQLGAR